MGQSKKKRACPALNRDIPSAECGANRISKYACPATCEHNLFTARNYDALLALETSLDRKTLHALARLHPNPHGFARSQSEAARRYGPAGEHGAAMRAVFFDPDASGRTIAQRWLAAEGDRLSNDERTLLRAKLQARPILIEVQRVLDADHVEVIDLFDPDRRLHTLLDRSLAATVGRFTTMMVWVYPLPTLLRVVGVGFEPPEIPAMPAVEVVDAIIRHLGGGTEPAARTTWLWQHFEELPLAFQATAHERRKRQLAATDATIGQASYALGAPAAECLAALAGHPDITSDTAEPGLATEGFEAARVWLEPAQIGSPGTRHMLGRLLFKADTLRLDAIGGARLDQLKAKAEAALGSRIRFTAERRDDIGARFVHQDSDLDPSLVPPELLENVGHLELSSSVVPPAGAQSGPDHLLDIRRNLLRTVLHEKVPALGNLSPLEAAWDPSRRAALVEWTKGLIRMQDGENLRTGTRDDLMNGVARELNLPELDLEPPPLRKPPVGSGGAWDDMDEEDEDIDGDIFDGTRLFNSDWSAPPLPPEPLTPQEATTRMRMAMHVTPTAEAAMNAIDDSGNPLLDEMSTLLEPDLDEDEVELALAFVVQLWFALVPRGQQPLLNYARIRDTYEREIKRINQATSGESVEEQLFKHSPQPALMMCLASLVVTADKVAPKARRLRGDAGVAILLGLKSLLTELDHALRTA